MDLQSLPDAAASSKRNAGSSLARLQLGCMFLASACTLAWAGWMWPSHPMASLGGLALVILGYALVLGAEFLAAVLVSRRDEAPRPSAAQWFGAWWQEVKVAPQVFAWRQPLRWRSLPDTVSAKQTCVPAVVLVHGFFCNRGFWLPWMERLKSIGVPYVSVNLEPVFGSIDEYVSIVDDAIVVATALTGKPPTLICHSMGGLAARAWLAAAPGRALRVHKIITIGTPHRGTWLARFSHLDNGRQMRHNCDWQMGLMERELAMDANRHADRFVCWYSNTDNIVFPASTATLPGADNRHIAGTAHVALAFHPTVMNESLAMLASGASSPCARTTS